MHKKSQPFLLIKNFIIAIIIKAINKYKSMRKIKTHGNEKFVKERNEWKRKNDKLWKFFIKQAKEKKVKVSTVQY